MRSAGVSPPDVTWDLAKSLTPLGGDALRTGGGTPALLNFAKSLPELSSSRDVETDIRSPPASPVLLAG